MANKKHLRPTYKPLTGIGVTDDVRVPTYSIDSIREFARATKQSRTTVNKQIMQGHCKWTPPGDRGMSDHNMYSYWNSHIYNIKATPVIGLDGLIVRVPICLAWTVSISRFIRECGSRPSPKHRLTMINSSKGFTPGNIYWRLKYTVKETNKMQINKYDIRCLQL